MTMFNVTHDSADDVADAQLESRSMLSIHDAIRWAMQVKKHIPLCSPHSRI
jgi:hypothetical protein